MAGIYIEKKTRYLPFITGLGAFINIAGNFILIPLIGIMGAALVTLLSYFSMLLYIYKVSQKYYPVEFDLKKLYLLNLINVLALTLFYLSYSNIIPSNIPIKLLLSVLLSILIIYISGLWKIKYVLK